MSASFSIDELVAANQTLWDFLDAVRAGDEEVTARLLFPPTAWRLGAQPGNVAARFLESWAVPAEILPRLAIVHSARIIDDELVGFGIIAADEGAVGYQLIDGPRGAWALALIKNDAGWQVWGTPEAELWKQAEIVPLPPPAVGRPN